jgi:hypothetical protein
MLKRSAIVGLALLVLFVGVLPVAAAQRTVLAELFGATW